MKINNEYFFKLKIQFEDCDMQGIVHHPKILNFFERARLKALEDEGFKYEDLLKNNICFVISDLNMKFLKPLSLGQEVWIKSTLEGMYSNYIKIYQSISLDKNINISHIKS